MLDSKFFFTLVGLIIAVFAVCNTSFTPVINESFLPSRTVRVEREVYPEGLGNCRTGYGVPTNYQAMSGDLKYVSRPNFQSSLSPRFSSTNYGANIKYNMPSYENQAVPCNPTGDMATEGYSSQKNRENYCRDGNCKDGCGGGCTVAKCGKGGANYSGDNVSENPKYVADMNNAYHVPNDMLPVGDMSQVVGADGSVQNQFNYDRYIYATQKSNLAAQGDFIRGDLPIMPHPKCGWFNVSVTPHIDLQKGALNVMGGVDNASSRELAALMSLSAGDSQKGHFVGGVDMTQDYMLTGSGGMARDVTVTSFL
jgi:hypothetical protein